MSTALHFLRLLDILSSMPAGPSVARLVSTALCTASLRNPMRNAGLNYPFSYLYWENARVSSHTGVFFLALIITRFIETGNDGPDTGRGYDE